MRFISTKIAGVFLIELEEQRDERGLFARSFCAEEFLAQGLNPKFVQCSLSYNRRAGTVRGLHWQAHPYGEDKLIRCTAGAIYDVALDLRSDSESYLKWFACRLDAIDRAMLYVPIGCAHGFQTLCDDSEVLYQISVPYRAEAARGARWNDPAFGIEWPYCDSRILSARDSSFPNFHG